MLVIVVYLILVYTVISYFCTFLLDVLIAQMLGELLQIYVRAIER